MFKMAVWIEGGDVYETASTYYTSNKYKLFVLVSLLLSSLNNKLARWCFWKVNMSCELMNSVHFYFRGYCILVTASARCFGEIKD